MNIQKKGRYWAVYADDGALICVAVYKKGAQEVVRRLGGLKIDKFWVVIKPSQQSSLGDILFETSATRLAVNSGLKEKEVHAFYSGHDEAVQEAKRILDAFKKSEGTIR
ncbi:MAG: hypothetical protein UY62_C0005G0012 [Parcubacteria group bacterium GW2011_GWF2_50_9]|nr:MAG: hypothetical protein UY62_C0005G0012 [Parcubacteria group bacterium GW2011_GWF2_50_9]